MKVTRIVEVQGGNVLLTHTEGNIEAAMECQGFYFSHTFKSSPVSNMTEDMARGFYDAALKYLKGE